MGGRDKNFEVSMIRSRDKKPRGEWFHIQLNLWSKDFEAIVSIMWWIKALNILENLETKFENKIYEIMFENVLMSMSLKFAIIQALTAP